jgi:hypothetical protein
MVWLAGRILQSSEFSVAVCKETDPIMIKNANTDNRRHSSFHLEVKLTLVSLS